MGKIESTSRMRIINEEEKCLPRVLEVNVDDLDNGGVYSLIRSLILHKKPDLEIDIASIERFVHPENVQELEKCGATVHYIGYEGSKWKKQIVCYRNLKALLKKEAYNYVHIHADVANKLLVSGLAAKHAGVSHIILHSHSSGVEGGHRKAKMVFHKACRRLLKNIGTQYAACSRIAADWMFPNIRPERVTIINNGIDLERFRYSPAVRERVRKELGIHDELLLGHVGRFGYPKNPEYLIRIMSEVRKRKLNAKLLLVGQGPMENEIRELVRQENLEDQVRFFGPTKRVHDLMQAMDVFLLPSRFEGFPVVGVEAQAAGLPVVFSDQITRDAGLCSNVMFLPIAEEAVPRWMDAITELSRKPRTDNVALLKNKGFSIEGMVRSFEELYGVDHK